MSQREKFEAAVIARLKESGFLEVEIRTECLVRCEDGYQDELINAGWHYWNAALANSEQPVAWLRPGEYVPIQNAPFGAMWISDKDDPRAFPVYASSSVIIPSDVERTKAARDVLAERRRQIEAEGWTPQHDDEHDAGILAGAGSAYALNAACLLHPQAGDAIEEPPESWLFEKAWWKPNMGDNPRRDLVKAAALIIAEIESIDRAADAPKCPICDEPFKAEHLCATDIELGICHAKCLEGSPVVDLETGDEIPDGRVSTYLFGSEDTANG